MISTRKSKSPYDQRVAAALRDAASHHPHQSVVVSYGDELYSYTCYPQKGKQNNGVLNAIVEAPLIQSKPMPLAVEQLPLADLVHLYDRDSALQVMCETLKQYLTVELYGSVGTGKRVLMQQLLHQRDVTACFTDGVVQLSVAERPVADLLQLIYDAFFESVPAFKPSADHISEVLQEKQALIILTASGLNKADMEWLIETLPTCTFLLVSETRLYHQPGAAIALQGLPLLEAIALMERDLGYAFSVSEKVAAKRLWIALSGNPLQLRRAAAQINKSAGEGPTSLVDWVALWQNAGGAEGQHQPGSWVRSLFSSLADKLTPSEQRILALMGAMGQIALTAEEVQAILQVPQTDLILSKLVKVHLVTSHGGDRFQLCQDLVGLVPERFGKEPWLAHAADYFAGAVQVSNAEAVMHLLQWTQQTGRWQESLGLARRLDELLAVGRQWQQWQQVLAYSLQAAQQNGDAAAEAWALHQLGTRSLAMGDADQASLWLSRSAGLRDHLKDRAGAAASRHNLSLLESSFEPFLKAYGRSFSRAWSATRAVEWSSRGKKLWSAFAWVVLLVCGGGGVVWLGSNVADLADGFMNRSAEQPLADADNDIVSESDAVQGKLPTEAGGSLQETLSPFDDSTVMSSSQASLKRESLDGQTFGSATIDPAAPIVRDSVIETSIGTEPFPNPSDSLGTSTEAPSTPADSNPVDSEGDTVASIVKRSAVPRKEPVPISNPFITPGSGNLNANSSSDNTSGGNAYPNEPPAVMDVSLEFNAGEPNYRFDLLGLSQAYDPNADDTLSVVAISNDAAEGGRLENNGDGTATYIPSSEVGAGAATAENRFSFTVSDSKGETDSGVVSIVLVRPGL